MEDSKNFHEWCERHGARVFGIKIGDGKYGRGVFAACDISQGSPSVTDIHPFRSAPPRSVLANLPCPTLVGFLPPELKSHSRLACDSSARKPRHRRAPAVNCRLSAAPSAREAAALEPLGTGRCGPGHGLRQPSQAAELCAGQIRPATQNVASLTSSALITAYTAPARLHTSQPVRRPHTRSAVQSL